MSTNVPNIIILFSSKIDMYNGSISDTTIGSLVRASEHVPSNSYLQKTNKVADIEPVRGTANAHLGMHFSKR